MELAITRLNAMADCIYNRKSNKALQLTDCEFLNEDKKVN